MMLGLCWRLGASILCLFCTVNSSDNLEFNTEAPIYGSIYTQIQVDGKPPISGSSNAFAKHPWVARLLHRATNLQRTRCTLACVKEAVFISATRCLLGMMIGLTAVQYKDLIFETKAMITPGARYRTKQAFDDIGVVLVHENKDLEKWDTIAPVDVQRTGTNYSWFQKFEVVSPKKADYMVVGFEETGEKLYELDCYPGLNGCMNLLYRDPISSKETYMKKEYFQVPCISFCSFDEFNVEGFVETEEHTKQCLRRLWIEGSMVTSTESNSLLGVVTWGPGLFSLDDSEWYVLGLAVPNSRAYAAAMRCADAINDGAVIDDKLCDDF